MAAIYGIELKNVNISQGVEDYIVNAEIYFENQLIGVFIDDGTGGSSLIKFSCDTNLKDKFYYSSWRYFASYPDIDTLALYNFSKKEFVELKGNLPKISYKDWPDDKTAIFFVEKIIYLLQIERHYKTAVEEGYKAIVVARFFALKNAKAEPDKIFYTDNTHEQSEQIISSLNENGQNYIINVYDKAGDFIIE